MGLYKQGNIVYFTIDQDIRNVSVGMIIDQSDKEYMIFECGYVSNSVTKISKEVVRPLSDKDNILKEINEYYDIQINELNAKIKSVNRIDYPSEISDKYILLKNEIKNTAKNMFEAEDDFDFENRLKAICQKKKQLFSIECEGISSARKHNGAIKYEIKELEKDKRRIIYNLNEKTERLVNCLFK